MKTIRMALPAFCVAPFLVGAPPTAAELQLSWTGTLQGIFLDNGGVYTGATAGVTQFSGTFTYDVANVFAHETSDGDNVVEPTDVWVDYFLHSASFSITNGTTEVSENQPAWFTMTIENDSPCSGSPDTPAECSELTEIYGEPIDNPTYFDTWSVDAAIAFASSDLEIGIGYFSRNTTLFPAGDLALRPLPPWLVPSANNDHRAVFYLFEFDNTVGGGEADIFSAWGTLENVQIVPDSDGDGLFDNEDNCIDQANVDQRDTNNDDIGNACDADLNGDCLVNFGDLALLKAGLFPVNDPDADFDGDGLVNFGDLAFMKSTFFNSANPGPGPGAPGNACE